MNIWICKYGKENFDLNYLLKVQNLKKNNPQLEEAELLNNTIANFHFLSLYSKKEKQYLSVDSNSILGYSGLLIGRNSIEKDLRNVQNISIDTLDEYNGQFSIFSLNIDGLTCKVDALGFHKVFYFESDNEIYVTNYLELLKLTSLLKPDITAILNSYSTNRFGVTLGNKTNFKDVFTLPEYGNLEISHSGALIVKAYKDIDILLVPDSNFESQLNKTISEYRIAANYLRKYHDTVVPLSGGYDGRLILNFFYKTNGRSLETMTYNRAGILDLIIAGVLSKKTGVSHEKIKINIKNEDFEVSIPDLKNPESDVFTSTFYKAVKKFYKSKNSFKVSLGGNGGDTDWEFGETQMKALDKSSFCNFIRSYAKLISHHPLFSENLIESLTKKNEKYLLNKYEAFSNKKNFIQLLGSSFFHLERFRQQGYTHSQFSNKYHDIFAPFATESFNKLVFCANKRQLQRGLKEGIQYRLNHGLTNGNIPYAPILTAQNELGNNKMQKMLNRLAPYLPKIIWKLNNGDTNAKLRRKFSSKINDLSKHYILDNEDSQVWNLIEEDKVRTVLKSDNYDGKYNEIAVLMKFIEDNA